MRKPIIAGNWKMHKTGSEAVSLVAELKPFVADAQAVEVVVCPTFTALAPVAKELEASNIKLGAQNMHWEPQGAYTGEISAAMLKDCGCTYVILGHSERRQYFGETDANVSKKAKAAFAAGLVPIICVGELLEQREAGQTETVVKTQTVGSLQGLTAAEVQQAVIAYEPVWAIGTGKTASSTDAEQVCAFIRQVVAELYDHGTAEQVRIQYGGSVKPDNISELMSQPNIDGALVGGASLEAIGFSKIVKY